MKKKLISSAILSGILLFYAFLYMATSPPERPEPECGVTCQKIQSVDTLLRRKPNVNRTSVYNFYTIAGVEPKDSTFFVYVKDSLQSDWNGLADTACLYLNNVMLYQYRIKVVHAHDGRTVVDRKCP